MIDYACLGYCTFCHEKIGEISEGKIKWFFTRKKLSYRLNNGSKMDDNLCETCENMISLEHFPQLMLSHIKGWEEDMKQCEMTEDEKSRYRDNYYKLEIIERI